MGDKTVRLVRRWAVVATLGVCVTTLAFPALAPADTSAPVTGFFGDGTQAAPFAERPSYDTTGPAAPGQRGADGTWTFDITAIAQGWAQGTDENNGVAIVPAAPAQGDLYEVVWHGSGDQAP